MTADTVHELTCPTCSTPWECRCGRPVCLFAGKRCDSCALEYLYLAADTFAGWSDEQVLARLAELDGLLVEARGDHPELAAVRATISAQVDLVLAECDNRDITPDDEALA